MVDVWAHLILCLLCAALSWFARDEADADQLDKDMGHMVVAMSFLVWPVVLPVALSMLYDTYYENMPKRRNEIAEVFCKMCVRVAANTDSFYTYCDRITEWDYFFLSEASKIIRLEFLGEQLTLQKQTTADSFGSRCVAEAREDLESRRERIEKNIGSGDLSKQAESDKLLMNAQKRADDAQETAIVEKSLAASMADMLDRPSPAPPILSSAGTRPMSFSGTKGLIHSGKTTNGKLY